VQLGQERLKLGDDGLHRVRHVMERLKNRITTGNLQIFERYISLEIDVLVVLRVSASGNAQEFLAQFNAETLAQVPQPNARLFETPRIKSTRYRDNQSVLIVNVESMEMPERIVRSSVRLYDAQEFYHCRPQLRYLSFAKGRIVLLSSFCNGKFSGGSGLLPANFYELPRKVIQSTAEIVDSVSKNSGDFIGQVPDSCDVISNLSNLRLVLGSKRVEVSTEKIGDDRIQVSDVLVGPFNFQADTANPITHQFRDSVSRSPQNTGSIPNFVHLVNQYD
jgi:hypothetical protein